MHIRLHERIRPVGHRLRAIPNRAPMHIRLHERIRPVGPEDSRPGRKAGKIRMDKKLSAEGAALNQKHIGGHIQYHDGGASQETLAENPFFCDARADCQYIR
jgi:hypothetical protein